MNKEISKENYDKLFPGIRDVSNQPSAALAGYIPSVGDKFHKPAGTYRDLFTGAIKDTLERNAEITMMSHNHVVIIVDGLESTMTRSKFIKLAKNTIKSGATLTRRT